MPMYAAFQSAAATSSDARSASSSAYEDGRAAPGRAVSTWR